MHTVFLSWIINSFMHSGVEFSFSFNSNSKPTMKCFIWPFWRWARQLLRPFSWGGNWPIMRWHMPDNHCSINACSMCIWQVCCWVCPPVVRLGFYILHPHIISLQVPSLYGLAAASRRVIGYRADCFACGPFFRPFVVSFFFFFSEPPTLPSRLLFTCTWLQSAHTQDNHSHCFHFGLFGSFFRTFFCSLPTYSTFSESLQPQRWW